jgi:hypothetical protein
MFVVEEYFADQDSYFFLPSHPSWNRSSLFVTAAQLPVPESSSIVESCTHTPMYGGFLLDWGLIIHLLASPKSTIHSPPNKATFSDGTITEKSYITTTYISMRKIRLKIYFALDIFFPAAEDVVLRHSRSSGLRQHIERWRGPSVSDALGLTIFTIPPTSSLIRASLFLLSDNSLQKKQ